MSVLSKSWFKAIIALVIIAMAVLAWVVIKNSAPKPERKPPEKVLPLVNVTSLERQTARPMWQAGGTVRASQSVDLVAQVSGKVDWIAKQAVPGAQIKKGSLLAKIEAVDYELVVQQQQAALEQAQTNLMLEQAQADLAFEEYQLSGKQLNAQDQALVLRKPQLQAAQASVRSATASLQQAKKNLQRTEIRMPFTGKLIQRNIDLGAFATSNTAVFRVVATDAFWLDVKIPPSFAKILETQETVLVNLAQPRAARVLNILPEVDSADRQVKVILEIPDPLNTELGGQIFINDYVDVQLPAKEIDDAYTVPRSYLKDSSFVWVVNQEKLHKRLVDIVYLGRDSAWISAGFEPDDLLLVSQLDVPVEDMQVRVAKPTGE